MGVCIVTDTYNTTSSETAQGTRAPPPSVRPPTTRLRCAEWERSIGRPRRNSSTVTATNTTGSDHDQEDCKRQVRFEDPRRQAQPEQADDACQGAAPGAGDPGG